MANPFDDTKPPKTQDLKRDQALKESFPASDPPSTTPPPGSRKAEIEEAAGDAEPKGLPTSDRHASEVSSAPGGSVHAAHTKTA
jgi:hypothetical protein